MVTLAHVGEIVAARRKTLGLSQATLAKLATVGHSTLDAFENGRIGELGFSKVNKILSALGLELRLQEASYRRPTLEELMSEEARD